MTQFYQKLSKYSITKKYDFNQDRKMVDIDLENAFLGIRKAISINTSPLTVTEQDGVPSVASVTTIKFANGTVTDDGGGTVSISGGGGSGDITDVGDCASGAAFSSGGTGTTLTFRNATSGTIDLKTVAGALGTVTQSLPARTATIVNGPSSATDNMCSRFDGTSGNLLQDGSIYNTDDGKVGMGTSSPSTKLDVESAVNDSGIDINNTITGGGSSCLFPGGSKADNVSIPTSNSVNTTGAWTVRGWARFDNSTNTYCMLFSSINSGATNYVQIWRGGVDNTFRIVTPLLAYSSSWFATTDVWYFLEWSYDPVADKIRSFIDGIIQTNQTETNNIMDLRNEVIQFGADATEGRQLVGSMVDWEVSDVVRNTSNYIPPSAPLVADAHTLLLLNYNGVDGATTTTDSSSFANTVNMNGDTEIDTAEFKFAVTGISGPRIKFQNAGTTYFTAGVDGSDSNKFKIGTTALSTNTRLAIDADGRVGVNVSGPTAYLHLPAGTTAASTAPLKINAGTNLTTPEDGAVEYNGTHYYGTVGSTRYQLDQQATGTNTGDQLIFKTIAVSGQSDVVADTTADTLTLVAGTNMTITTNAGTDTVTLNSGAPGLEFISATPFSAASTTGSISITGGQKYRFIFISTVDSGGAHINMQFDVVNLHSSYLVDYPSAGGNVTSGGVSGNVANFRLASSAVGGITVIGDILPQAVEPTRCCNIVWNSMLGNDYATWVGGVASRKTDGSNALTNFNISPSAGTITGTVWLYKYRDS